MKTTGEHRAPEAIPEVVTTLTFSERQGNAASPDFPLLDPATLERKAAPPHIDSSASGWRAEMWAIVSKDAWKVECSFLSELPHRAPRSRACGRDPPLTGP